MVPVAAVASAPPGARTEACMVTGVPTRTGPGVTIVRSVVVGTPGGGGSGNVPCKLRVITLPTLPEKRAFTVFVAIPQFPADDVVGNVGMVKSDSDTVTEWVLVS